MLWVILGIILGLILYHVAANARAGHFKVRWYQWILGVAAAILILLAMQNYYALQDELEPAAAGLSWLLFGLPAVVLVALIWAIPAVAGLVGRRRAAAPARTASSS